MIVNVVIGVIIQVPHVLLNPRVIVVELDIYMEVVQIMKPVSPYEILILLMMITSNLN